MGCGRRLADRSLSPVSKISVEHAFQARFSPSSCRSAQETCATHRAGSPSLRDRAGAPDHSHSPGIPRTEVADEAAAERVVVFALHANFLPKTLLTMHGCQARASFAFELVARMSARRSRIARAASGKGCVLSCRPAASAGGNH